MLLHITIKEFREYLFSIRFALTLGVLLVLVTAAVLVLSADYRDRVDDYNRRTEQHRRAASQYAGGGWVTVDRPMPVLASLFRGLTPVASDRVVLAASSPPSAEQQTEIDATDQLFPTIDLGFCIGVVLSLIALLFSYDLITDEKERGTLKLMLANSIPRAAILTGKWLAVFATLAVATIIALVYAVLLATVLPNSRFTLHGSDWAALGMILLTSLLYLSSFLLLGMFVSSLVTRSASSLAILMLAWTLLVFVVPNASPYLAVWLSPAPTNQHAQRERIRLDSDLTAELRRRHEAGAKKVRDEKLDHVAMQRVYDEIQAEWNHEHKATLLGPAGQFRREVHRQENAGARLASLSPYGSAIYAFSALADSGAQSDDRFLQVARLFDEDRLTTYARAAQTDPPPHSPAGGTHHLRARGADAAERSSAFSAGLHLSANSSRAAPARQRASAFDLAALQCSALRRELCRFPPV